MVGYSCRFESCPDYSGYLIPGSTVTTIGVFGTTHEWWRKVRGTCKGIVPETKETRRRGDLALVANLYQYSQVAEWYTYSNVV